MPPTRPTAGAAHVQVGPFGSRLKMVAAAHEAGNPESIVPRRYLNLLLAKKE